MIASAALGSRSGDLSGRGASVRLLPQGRVRHPDRVCRSAPGEDIMEEYERLRKLVEAAADDVAKAEGGNKAAGTRVRKTMQEIKAAAQEVRKKILESRSAAPG